MASRRRPHDHGFLGDSVMATATTIPGRREVYWTQSPEMRARLTEIGENPCDALTMAVAEPAAACYDDELRNREALREAFGDSSESDSDGPPEAASSPQVGAAGRERWRWEAVAEVRGLWLCADFLSSDDQSRLLAAIQREGWFNDASNQAMRFGDLPPWSVELSTLVRECIGIGDISVGIGQGWMNEDEDACPLPSDLLWREPLFNQLIANRYKPGDLCSC